LAVKTISKLFAGEIIESARHIQTQWIKATGEDQTGGLLSPPAEDGIEPQNETRRGPLLPDHLREAIRRYKLTREGGLAGQLGLWQIQQQGGVERFGVRVKGKRLLK
jgi:transcription initiation factor TFIID subunit 11